MTYEHVDRWRYKKWRKIDKNGNVRCPRESARRKSKQYIHRHYHCGEKFKDCYDGIEVMADGQYVICITDIRWEVDGKKE